jgi:hypothetical protein
MKFRNDRGVGLTFPALDLAVPAGETFEVTDETVIASLKEQGFPEATGSGDDNSNKGDSKPPQTPPTGENGDQAS